MARGDRLEVDRRALGSTVAYAHQGIDVGDGTVVHARPDDFRDPLGGGRVVRTGIDEFAAGATVRVRHDPPPAFAPEEIVARALAHVGRAGYCPVADNCEHFATWCATGRRSSRQVDLVVARVASAAGRVVAALSARAGGRVGIAAGALVGATLWLAGSAAAAAVPAALWAATRAGRGQR